MRLVRGLKSEIPRDLRAAGSISVTVLVEFLISNIIPMYLFYIKALTFLPPLNTVVNIFQ